MKKITLGLIAALVLTLSLPITATAAQMRSLSSSERLLFDGTTAYCRTNVIDNGKALKVTMELWHGNELVDSWSVSGIGVVSVEGNCQVVKGQTYTLIVSGTTDGKPFSRTPISKTC